ncbi:TPA: hypothetical protein ACH3X1_012826 [Trebouxia sp. C0004]
MSPTASLSSGPLRLSLSLLDRLLPFWIIGAMILGMILGYFTGIDTGLNVVQVDTIVLYAPLALFYLQVVSCQFLGGGQALHIGFWQVCRSVLIFLGAPLVVGIVTRHGFIAWRAGYTYDKAVTQAFTSSSNNFELAIAIAVGMFGINSQEALAAIVGLSDRDSSVVGSSVL